MLFLSRNGEICLSKKKIEKERKNITNFRKSRIFVDLWTRISFSSLYEKSKFFILLKVSRVHYNFPFLIELKRRKKSGQKRTQMEQKKGKFSFCNSEKRRRTGAYARHTRQAEKKKFRVARADRSCDSCFA